MWQATVHYSNCVAIIQVWGVVREDVNWVPVCQDPESQVWPLTLTRQGVNPSIWASFYVCLERLITLATWEGNRDVPDSEPRLGRPLSSDWEGRRYKDLVSLVQQGTILLYHFGSRAFLWPWKCSTVNTVLHLLSTYAFFPCTVLISSLCDCHYVT